MRYFPHKKALAWSLALFGIALWAAAMLLHMTPANRPGVNFPHFQERLMAVVIGGAAVTGGIILLTAG